MSDNNIRRRFPVSRRTSSRALKPSPSGSRRYTPVPVNRRSSKQHRDTNYKALERSKSEPCVLKIGFVDFEDDDRRDAMAQSLEILFRPQTCSDLFVSPDYLISGSPPSFQKGYKKDAKVVVNVTVEGSPGAVRTMVKLGSSVDETIRLVIDKYSEEGRTPRLDKNRAHSSFQLYQSHFSLQSLSNTDVIGDVGSRSFYLRKSNSNGSNQEITTDQIAPVKANAQSLIVFDGFFGRKINKIIRRTCRLWKFLGCMQ
ncbi:uncharacterized protein At4g22758-like isoform X1 [Solanum stenotomum]|uniref:uncharacterized protein At4g22758-like isoform X1 n=1 Tax=Solanum stenotomum TaxID=172797 RepID=UPI0020D081E6|nr:uncharacterized protein At4g22758-like isoform X1 [Solanum stenotomum]